MITQYFYLNKIRRVRIFIEVVNLPSIYDISEVKGGFRRNIGYSLYFMIKNKV
jgi:hypothetical protein